MKTKLPATLTSNFNFPKGRSPQITITFPEKKVQLREDLLKMKEEDSLNLSAYVVSCIEDRMGVYA